MIDTWDVIVVGAGSAGLPLAITAAERGARVLQVEADERIGGTLHWSSGQIAGAGTRLQASLGIPDSPDQHFEDAQRIANGQIDPLVLRLLVDNAGETIDWLTDRGFEPAAGMPVAGEAHEAYRTRRYLWGDNQGLSVLEALRPHHDALVKAGKIDLRMGTRMTSLITDTDGAVTGVRAETPEGEQVFAGRNVVLTTGGYAANADLWQSLTPSVPLCSLCNPYSRGDGLTAARELGATVDGGEKFLCTFAGYLEDNEDPTSGQFLLLSPQARNVWELFVDDSGERFMQEDHPSIDYRERKLLSRPGMRMSVVFDHGILLNAGAITLLDQDAYRAKFGEHPNFVKADTIAELAEHIEVPVEALEKTVAEYNASVERGHDEKWHKHFLIRPLTEPPFYAIRSMGITVLSPAGLKVDAQLNVLKEDGAAVPNLFAAGEVLGFGRTSGNAFVGGLSLTPALTFGRLLGDRLLAW